MVGWMDAVPVATGCISLVPRTRKRQGQRLRWPPESLGDGQDEKRLQWGQPEVQSIAARMDGNPGWAV
jgi:hypothetical protein